MARHVAIVPHTHWDREWYAPFQTFRARLVDLLDALLAELDADPSYAHFMLDGQMAVVDDYLEVRPEAEDRLRRLAASGRLSIGPWYVLMDEFLVSGECMIRNLQLGLRRAAAFAGAMPVGYLPDMFGHVAQMPQLLRQFGFEHAVVWRGVPAAVDRTAFWWTAPDGSRVRTEYLPQGYNNGAVVPGNAQALVSRIDEWAELFAPLLDAGTGSDDGGAGATPILWMNGTDHLMPQPWLGPVAAEANRVQDDYRLEVTSLARYLGIAPVDDLPVWEGELRSGARANLLMGVASNRVDVKQAAARAERALERLAEPLAAMFLPAEAWPGALLDLAWREVIRNSAHDSICACSHDDVGRAVLHRYAEATHVAEAIAERAVVAAGAHLAPGAPFAVNPSPRRRSGLVELWVAGSGETPRPGTQVLEIEPAQRTRTYADASMAMMAIRELEWHRAVRGVVIRKPDGEAGEELLRIDRTEFGELLTAAVNGRLLELVESRPDGEVVVVEHRRARQRVLARFDAVPGYGWQRWTPGPLTVEPVVGDAEAGALANGLVMVWFDPELGTFAIDDHEGLGRLVDDGDVGDTYNYCPPAEDVVVDRPLRAEVDLLEEGPLRGRLELRATYAWPASSDGTGRAGVREVDVVTVVELRAGERLVRVETTFDNRCRDHRLRAWFRLPEPAAVSSAECAFAVVERGLTAEGGPTEAPMPTFPSRRFVRAGGLTLVHDGLLEYELLDIDESGDAGHRASALALTLVRSTGLLSQGPMPTRPMPAGPVVAAEAAQLQGPLTVRYAVHLGEADPYALVDDAFLPMIATEGTSSRLGEGERGQALGVGGAEVSALRRDPSGAVELRVFNPSAEPTTVTVHGRRGWLVDLLGRPLERFDGRFVLDPWRIGTARLDPD